MARSLLRQLTQISGSANYNDTLPMALAETAGDLTLEKDLNFLRSQFKVVTGKSNWFDAPDASLSDLNTDISNIEAEVANNNSSASADIAGLKLEDAYIDTFIGKAIGNHLPVYSSHVYVADGDNLDIAIGKLDAALEVTAPTKFVEDVVSVINAETAHTLPGGNTYTLDPTGRGENLDVYHNGQLLAVDSGSVARDYAETSTTQVTFHYTVIVSSNLTYVIRG